MWIKPAVFSSLPLFIYPDVLPYDGEKELRGQPAAPTLPFIIEGDGQDQLD